MAGLWGPMSPRGLASGKGVFQPPPQRIWDFGRATGFSETVSKRSTFLAHWAWFLEGEGEGVGAEVFELG